MPEPLSPRSVERIATNFIDRFVPDGPTGVKADAAKITGQIETLVKNKLFQFVEDFSNTVTSSANGWYDENSQDMTVYPNGTRMVHRSGITRFVVVEEEPRTRTITVGTNVGREHHHEDESLARDFNPGVADKRYHLGFPYVVFVMEFANENLQKAHVFFRPTPLKSVKDELFAPALTNLSGECVVCWSTSSSSDWNAIARESEYQNGTLSSRIGMAIKYFWASKFTGDWVHHLKWYRDSSPEKLGTFDLWQKATIENKLFFLGMPMRRITTLEVVLQEAPIVRTIIPAFRTDTCKALQKLVTELEPVIRQAVSSVQSTGTSESAADIRTLVKHAIVYAIAEAELWNDNDDHWKRKYAKARIRHAEDIRYLMDIHLETGSPSTVIRELRAIFADLPSRLYDEHENNNDDTNY